MDRERVILLLTFAWFLTGVAYIGEYLKVHRFEAIVQDKQVYIDAGCRGRYEGEAYQGR
jgi:hypothetical protein